MTPRFGKHTEHSADKNTNTQTPYLQHTPQLIIENGSPRAFLSPAKTAAKTPTQSTNAYARILLNWYSYDKRFYHAVGDDEAPVEGQLLEALKTVTDSELRLQIGEELITK